MPENVTIAASKRALRVFRDVEDLALRAGHRLRLEAYLRSDRRPWRPGVVYLLPGASFKPQAPLSREGMTVHIAQAQSPTTVAPLARLAIQPDDFPFLAQIRGHDDSVIWDRARANPDAFPWLDDEA